MEENVVVLLKLCFSPQTACQPGDLTKKIRESDSGNESDCMIAAMASWPSLPPKSGKLGQNLFKSNTLGISVERLSKNATDEH